jgi:CHAT domain-containing protein
MWDNATRNERWGDAISSFESALSLWRQLGERPRELRLLIRLGREHEIVGEPDKALSYYEQALKAAQALGDRYQEANVLMGLGNTYNNQTEVQKALDYYNQARQIFAGMSRKFGEGIATENIGLTYLAMGDSQTALEHLKFASDTYSSLKARPMQCNVMNGMGTAYKNLDQPGQALESHNQALSFARESRAAGCEARTFNHLGTFFLHTQEKQQALEAFTKGLDLCRAIGDRVCEASALAGIGASQQLLGNAEKSLKFLSEALNGYRQARERAREAHTLRLMAQANISIGNLKEAREQLEQSIEIAELVRSDAGAERLRETFFASAQSAFDLYIDLLMKMHQNDPAAGHDAAALKVSERARARSLLDLLAEAGADIRRGVSSGLLDQERLLQKQINAKAAARAKLSADKAGESMASSLDKEIAALTLSYREVESKIRSASPSYAALTQPHPLSAGEIQNLLDDATVLLEFALGPKQSWLWAITREKVTSHKLAPRADIEAGARRLYGLITARQPNKNLNEAQQQGSIADADNRLQTEAAALSRLLFGPIAPRLEGDWKGKRLAIVASGALQYLPFSSLPVPTSAARPLIADHEIVLLPSASVLALLRRDNPERSSATKTLAVLADPVFDSADSRVAAAAKKRASEPLVASVRSPESSPARQIPAELERAISSFDSKWRGGFSRLPFSREEAESIAALIPQKRLVKATDFRASRDVATSGELSNYRIIHFATHGLLNSDHPELSGLVLSLVDEAGRPQDGFLRMHEIYNLKLPADLVVLSACQTALGKEIKGEGLVGLTRGFMYAGAKRVVASLWQVDDLATAKLMQLFYQGMLKEGLAPPAALRVAQLELAKQKRWASPYFWAAFVIQGEWR